MRIKLPLIFFNIIVLLAVSSCLPGESPNPGAEDLAKITVNYDFIIEKDGVAQQFKGGYETALLPKHYVWTETNVYSYMLSDLDIADFGTMRLSINVNNGLLPMEIGQDATLNSQIALKSPNEVLGFHLGLALNGSINISEVVFFDFQSPSQVSSELLYLGYLTFKADFNAKMEVQQLGIAELDTISVRGLVSFKPILK